VRVCASRQSKASLIFIPANVSDSDVMCEHLARTTFEKMAVPPRLVAKVLWSAEKSGGTAHADP
jgi:hypothetical protein